MIQPEHLLPEALAAALAAFARPLVQDPHAGGVFRLAKHRIQHFLREHFGLGVGQYCELGVELQFMKMFAGQPVTKAVQSGNPGGIQGRQLLFQPMIARVG